MTIIPQTINLQPPSYTPLLVDSLPDLYSVDYINIPTDINPPTSPEFDPVLNKFYSVLLFSAVENKLDSLYNAINTIFSYINKRFKYEKTKLFKKYASELSSISNYFGIYGKGTFSGLFIKAINEAHYSELVDGTELVIKFRDDLIKLLTQHLDRFYESINKVNSLYKDIYEKDFNVTAKAYEQWIEYLITTYNTNLSKAKLEIEKMRTNVEIFTSKLNELKAQLLYYKELANANYLSNELKEAINNFYLSQHSYLIELERMAYLSYEEINLKNKLYSATLRKLATEIDKIRNIAKLITANISIFDAEYDAEREKLNVKIAEAETYSQKIDTEKLKIANYDELIESLYRKYMALYTIDKTTLIEKEKELHNYEKQLQLLLKDVSKSEFEKLASYIDNRESMLTFLKNELSARNLMTLTESKYRISIDTALDIMRSNYSAYSQYTSITAHAVADWYRTCALTSAQITASFIRSYS